MQSINAATTPNRFARTGPSFRKYDPHYRLGLCSIITHPNRTENERWLSAWVDMLAQWLNEGALVYAFVHCPDDSHSPETLRWLHQSLRTKVPQLPPLRLDHAPAFLQQGMLF